MQELTQESIEKARKWFSASCLAMATKAENTLSVMADSNKFSDNVYSDMQPLSKAGMIKAYKAWLISRHIGFKSVVGVLIN